MLLLGALVCAAAASLVSLPGLLHGFPAGHDTHLHATAWFDLLDHWKEGNFFPAWGARFAVGLGEPVFLFYPPLSLALGAALTAIFGAGSAPTIFLWLCVAIGAWGTFLLARTALDDRAAMLAALLFAASPYLALSGYDRNAFAELLATAILPYVLRAFLEACKHRSGMLYLGVALALVALTNIPATAVAATALTILAISKAAVDRSAAPIRAAAVGLALAFGLAGFFLVPVLYEKRWVLVEHFENQNWELEKHFPFASTAPWFQHEFEPVLRWVALDYVALTLMAGAAAFPKERRTRGALELWILSLACVVLMSSATGFLYLSLPGMRFVQFPWRYLLVLTVTTSVMLAALLRRERARYLLIAAALVLIFAWTMFWPPKFYNDPEAIWSAAFNERTRQLMGVSDYMPMTVPLGALERSMQQPAVQLFPAAPVASINIELWQTERREISFDVPQPSVILVRLNYYPGWRATIDGKPAPMAIQRDSGQVQVNVQGRGTLQLEFVAGQDRTLGWVLSLLTLGAMLVLHFRMRAAAEPTTNTA